MVEAGQAMTLEGLKGLSEELTEALIARYASDKNQFVDLESSREGLIYMCAGTLSLILLGTGFGKDDKASGLTEGAQKIILAEFKKVLDYVETKGYDATPIQTEEAAKKLFFWRAGRGERARYSYLDSVSWVLSLMLNVNLAVRRNQLLIEKADRDRLYETLKETLAIICDAECEGGGWGFTGECTSPDLYYSYAIAEALADFGDYVLGETEDIAEADKLLITDLGDELISRIKKVRKNVGNWLLKDFLHGSPQAFGKLGEKMIDPGLPAGKSQHLLLYYTLYVIDMIVVCGADQDEDGKAKPDVVRALEHAIYRTRIGLDAAIDDKAWWDSAEESSLDLKWLHNDDFRNKQKGNFQDPALVPLVLRCNALYSYYISGGQDKRMDELALLVLEDRDDSDECKLWDKNSYSLLVTERSIEALVDYADYLRKTGTTDSATAAGGGEIETVLKEFLQKELNRHGGQTVLPVETEKVPRVQDAQARQQPSINQFFDNMATAFSNGKEHLQGRKDLAPEVDPAILRDLAANTKDFLKELVFRTIIQACKPQPKPEQVDAIRKRFDAEVDALLMELGTYLLNPRIDVKTMNFAKVLNWANQEAALKLGGGGGKELK